MASGRVDVRDPGGMTGIERPPEETPARTRRVWPTRPVLELLAVAAVLAALLAALFAPVVFGSRTFAPNGAVSAQAGKPGVGYPYDVPERAVVNDGGSFVWIFEPMAKVVHDTYADGAIPLWNPYAGLGAPNAASFQTAPAGPFYAPVFLHPSQRAWDLVVLLRLLAGGLGCFVLLRVLGASLVPALVPSVGYLVLPAFVLWGGAVSISVEALVPWLLAGVVLLARRPTAPRFAAVALLTAAAILGGQPEVLVVLAYLAAAWALFWWIRVGRSWRVLAELAGAGAVGGLLAAPQLWLGAEYVRLAFDVHEGGLGDARFSLDTFKVVLLGDFAHREQASLAIVMLALAVAGVAGRRRAGVAGTGFLLAAAAVWAVRALDLPGGEQAVGLLLPGLDAVNIRRYGEVVLMVAGAVLAGAGVQALVRGSRPALVGAALTPLVPLALWATGGQAHGNVLPAFLLAAGVAVLGVLVVRFPVAAPLLAALFIFQFFLLTPRSYARRYDPYRPLPFAEYLQSHLRPGERAAGLRAVLHPQISSALRISDPRIEDALYPERYERYIHGLAGGVRANFAGLLDAEDAGSPFLAAAGVRFVASRPLAGPPGKGYRRVFRDVRAGVTVWENGAAYPRAWLPGSIEAAAGAREAEGSLRAGDGDLRARSVVENPTGAMRAATGTGAAAVERIGWNDARFRVRADGAAVLVTSDQYYPGWKATVDGEPTPIRPANLAMRAVAVPPGEHVVEFRYEPAGWRYGLLLSAVGALLLLARFAAAPASARFARGHR